MTPRDVLEQIASDERMCEAVADDVLAGLPPGRSPRDEALDVWCAVLGVLRPHPEASDTPLTPGEIVRLRRALRIVSYSFALADRLKRRGFHVILEDDR